MKILEYNEDSSKTILHDLPNVDELYGVVPSIVRRTNEEAILSDLPRITSYQVVSYAPVTVIKALRANNSICWLYEVPEYHALLPVVSVDD